MEVSVGDIFVNIKDKSLWKVGSVKSDMVEAESIADVEKTYIKKGLIRFITKSELKNLYQLAQKKN